MIYIAVIFLFCPLVVILQRQIYARRWDKGLGAFIAFERSEAFEGQSVGFSECLENGKFLPLPYVNFTYLRSVNLSQRDSDGNVMFYGRERNVVFSGGKREMLTRKTSLFCEKRGYYEIKSFTLTSSDLLMKRRYTKTIPVEAVLTVYPREIEVDETVIPYKRISGEILTKRYILPDPFEFSGIREYQPFDSARQINFNAWAKTGTLMSNVYGYTASQEVALVLNMERYSLFRRESVYEDAIRLAAFLARHYIDSGITVSFMTNGTDCITKQYARLGGGVSFRHLREIYEALARIDLQEDSERDIEHVSASLSEMTAAGSRNLVIILISPYHGEDLREWYMNARESRTDVLWIVPHSPNDEISPLLPRDAVIREVYDE